jgi:hypothetical protein
MENVAERMVHLSEQEFAHLGEGMVAYVKPMDSTEAKRLFPQAASLQPGMQLFALLAANGAPIMLADSKDAVIHTAWEQELATVSVH